MSGVAARYVLNTNDLHKLFKLKIYIQVQCLIFNVNAVFLNNIVIHFIIHSTKNLACTYGKKLVNDIYYQDIK